MGPLSSFPGPQTPCWEVPASQSRHLGIYGPFSSCRTDGHVSRGAPPRPEDLAELTGSEPDLHVFPVLPGASLALVSPQRERQVTAQLQDWGPTDPPPFTGR